MDVRTKMIVCGVPFLAAGAVAFFLTMPAYSEYNEKQSRLDSRKDDAEKLKVKLSDSIKLQKEKNDLDSAIAHLRGSVPKKPQIEILNLDLEKMCNDANLDLVSVTTPDKETLRKAGMEDESAKKTGAAKVAKPVAAAGGAAVTAKASAGPDAGEVGLSKLTLQVKCIGDYENVQKLVRDLETYKRVVAVSEIKVYVPKKPAAVTKGKVAELPDDGEGQEGEDQGDFHKLWCSFLLTAYYLP